MPIYAYRCEECGFAKDVLQKMSDEPLTVCLECGKSSFKKQVTAAGFQLKGSGWYVTDFRGGSGVGVGAAPAADTAPVSDNAAAAAPAVATTAVAAASAGAPASAAAPVSAPVPASTSGSSDNKAA
ncbi:MAG: zinc ribbon domain-containing protein [Undibacterium sp.]|uniref:FmdB family zinc ribbon protein n=1 Tax=Undibacterium sp. TaxID=1914977 RepID=UPI00271712D1|nr:FmdB family zinc ribbon protein [Undibacterium sp.]MDO8651923.1 zinc ribbon domain-containing protein [Undibacterium sp.]